MNFFKKYGYIIFLVFLIASLFDMRFALIAIICMVAPIIISLFGKGRYWCGNFCPRGSFFDNILSYVSPKIKVPRFFRSIFLRAFMILFIIYMFANGVSKNWGNLFGIGLVFYRIIVGTSIVGIVLGLFISHRTWCNFCPMGSIASLIAKIRGKKISLKVSSNCINCNVCTKTCPMGISPKEYKNGYVLNSDCIHCNECLNACPKNSIQKNF